LDPAGDEVGEEGPAEEREGAGHGDGGDARGRV
jgi:hypothetical protein